MPQVPKQSPVFGFRRTILILGVSLVLLGLLVCYFLQPFLRRVSGRYLDRGDTYLASQEYDAAISQYDKALYYDRGNAEAKAHMQLAQKAVTDIAALRDFYVEKKVAAVVEKIDLATKEYPTPKKALEAGVAFYNEREYVYAQYPLRQAVRLDPEYPEAWHYLGLACEQLAKDDPAFTGQAKQAFQKQNELTNKYLEY